MQKIILITIAVFFAFQAKAQDDNKRTTDAKTGQEILIGTVTREGLMSMGDWFQQSYDTYTPDSTTIELIKSHSSNYPWVFIVLGTWCGDSREQVPHFFKVMDALQYPKEQIFLVAVDRDKKAGNFCVGDYNIKLVPTFIITRDGDEMGRIIETPVQNIEKDFLDILNGRISAPEGN